MGTLDLSWEVEVDGTWRFGCCVIEFRRLLCDRVQKAAGPLWRLIWNMYTQEIQKKALAVESACWGPSPGPFYRPGVKSWMVLNPQFPIRAVTMPTPCTSSIVSTKFHLHLYSTGQAWVILRKPTPCLFVLAGSALPCCRPGCSLLSTHIPGAPAMVQNILGPAFNTQQLLVSASKVEKPV